MLCSHMTRVIIVGAGTFGASLAWWLSGRGDEVGLVDQFEPGDRRATSGGETRLIRCAHGAESDYLRPSSLAGIRALFPRARTQRIADAGSALPH